MSQTPRLRERREAVVREHMESENRHDFDTTIGTFEPLTIGRALLGVKIRRLLCGESDPEP